MTAKGYIGKELFPSLGEGAEAQVCGSFSQGLYLETADGRLLMIHDTRWGSVPFGIAVENAGSVLAGLGADAGDRAVIRGGALEVVSGSGEVLRLNLTVRKPEVPSGHPVSAGRFVRTARGALLASDKGALKALALDASLQTAYSRLALGIIGDRPVGDALPDLLGLGPGLTPSGDDLAVGWLYARLRRGIAKRETRRAAARVRAAMRGNTCSVSCAFLEAVTDGGIFSLFDEVVLAPDTSSLTAAISRLFEMGGNSGADILTGMILGLASAADVRSPKEGKI